MNLLNLRAALGLTFGRCLICTLGKKEGEGGGDEAGRDKATCLTTALSRAATNKSGDQEDQARSCPLCYLPVTGHSG